MRRHTRPAPGCRPSAWSRLWLVTWLALGGLFLAGAFRASLRSEPSAPTESIAASVSSRAAAAAAPRDRTRSIEDILPGDVVLAWEPAPQSVARSHEQLIGNAAQHRLHSARTPLRPADYAGTQLPAGVTLQVEDGLIVGVTTDKDVPDKAAWQDLVGTSYVPGDLHATDVTRPLWRSLRLELCQPDGSIATVAILRPLWWLEETGAEVGTTIDLAVDEAGLQGTARVLCIEPNQADSREMQVGSAVVIGTIHHSNAVVWDLVFDGDTDHPLGVTANHPLYSLDRQDWVPAGGLQLQERVATLAGASTLTGRLQRATAQAVYNLEVHRAHSYRVTESGILAHNTGIGCGLNRKYTGPIHHIASVNDKAFTPRFEKIFSRAGMSLESPWNRMRLEGHVGPHGKFYNANVVLNRLEAAVGTKTGPAARSALVEELKLLRWDIRHNGLDALLKARASWVDVMGRF